MKKMLLVLGCVLLMACGSTQSEVTEESSSQVTLVVPTADSGGTDMGEEATEAPPSPTEEPVAETPTATVIEVEGAAESPAEAMVMRPGDHYKGAEEPIVELVEYGDFQ